jgi:hypothetical protein
MDELEGQGQKWLCPFLSAFTITVSTPPSNQEVHAQRLQEVSGKRVIYREH